MDGPNPEKLCESHGVRLVKRPIPITHLLQLNISSGPALPINDKTRPRYSSLQKALARDA